MKHILLALGLASCTLSAFAQHSHEDNYNVSVFAGSGRGSINTEYQKDIDAAVKNSFPGWYVDIERNNGRFSDLYGKAMDVAGNNFEAKALNLMNDQLKDLGIVSSEWMKVRDAEAPKAHYVDFEQRINGHEVIFARLSFRFTKDGKIVRIKNRSYSSYATATAPTLTRGQVAQSNTLTTGIASATIAKTEVAATWVYFPVPAKNGYALRPVWEVTVVGTNGEREPLHLNGFIDGVTGELLYRTDEIKTIDVQVKGSVYKNGYAAGATLEPIPDMAVSVNGLSDTTDATGTVSSVAPLIDLDMALDGRWSTVFDDNTGVTPTFSVNGIITNQTVVFPNNTIPGGPQHVNAFYHVTIVHDFMKERLPAFTDFDFALETNVDVPGSCNAFYSGFGNNNSINFYTASGSCKSFALIGDIVYHEYGHGIARLFYADQGANSMRNGALNEGHADVWALSITKSAILGDQAIGTGYIRRYDQNPKVFPKDLEGEVHADGEIIAGSWWDVGQNINSVDTMSMIFANTFYDVSDGPNGMEGMVYHDVLISALMNDDDDANLGNGSPHFVQIVQAFAKHGIYLYADVKLNHQELTHQPSNTPITVNASMAITNPMFFDKLQLIYRNRTVAAWDTLDMTDNGSGNFTAQIPAQPAGSLLDYFFYVYDVLDIPTVSYPAGYNPDPMFSQQVTIPYQFAVGLQSRMQITFEQDATDWEIGNSSFETATKGKWVQAKPVASYYRPNGGVFGTFICQSAGDHTTGSGKCLVTGNSSAVNNSPGSTDVDGGITAVVTPAFDLTSFVYPIIEYYRWYSNDYSASGESMRRNDLWQTSIKSATTGYKDVESTLQSDTTWRRRIFAVDQYLPGARQGIQMRFYARDIVQSTLDDQGQSVVEAAIDDFFIYDGVPLGISDVAAAKALIYPNPADNVVKIQLEQGAEGTIALHDISGRMVSSLQMKSGTMSYELSTAGVAPGVYMLIIQTGKSIQSQKITVNHQ